MKNIILILLLIASTVNAQKFEVKPGDLVYTISDCLFESIDNDAPNDSFLFDKENKIKQFIFRGDSILFINKSDSCLSFKRTDIDYYNRTYVYCIKGNNKIGQIRIERSFQSGNIQFFIYKLNNPDQKLTYKTPKIVLYSSDYLITYYKEKYNYK